MTYRSGVRWTGGFQHRVHRGHRDSEERRQVEYGLELSKGTVAR